MSIIEERLPWLETFSLERGSHSPGDKACTMEAVAYIAGEPWSEHPECASPIIGAFLRSWNDSLPDEELDRLLRPYITRIIGTQGTKAQEEKRAWMCTDWLARECAPAFLRAAGLTEHAEALEGLAALTTTKRAEKAQPTLDAARSAAVASRAASLAASRAASRDASLDASAAASRAASRDASLAASGAASREASLAASLDASADCEEKYAASYKAASEVLAPTVKQLQGSALLLLDRMIAVGRKAA